MTKSPITLQELRRRIYVKAKAEKSWRFLRQGFGWKRWRPVPKLGPVVSKNTNELKTGAPGRRRVSSIIMMESATIKGLATRLCFWTRRRWLCCAGVFYHLPSTTTEKKWRLEQ